MQGLFALAAALVAALVLAGGARADASASLAAVKGGLARSVAQGWLDPVESATYGATAYRAARAANRLRGAQASNLASALSLVAARRTEYTRPRALALFSMLDLNTRYLARRPLPPAGTDVIDEDDGVLYRSFPGYGLQFHPLGNASRLAMLEFAGREDEAAYLAQALVDRSIARGGGLALEYYFPFGGGAPPWVSGMAQALFATALVRVEYREEARRVYATLGRGLLVSSAAGPWVRLYGFSSARVLNAQLQTAVSVEAYARLTAEPDAAALADRLRRSSLALLPKFDTGAWSRYLLGGDEAPLKYHRYVVELLGTLARQTGDERWTTWQERFDAYLHEPPEVSARAPSSAVVGRRPARVTFWISKRSRVVLSVGGRPLVAWVARGLHTLLWTAPRAGRFAASLTARDVAGNRTVVRLRPVVARKR